LIITIGSDSSGDEVAVFSGVSVAVINSREIGMGGASVVPDKKMPGENTLFQSNAKIP